VAVGLQDEVVKNALKEAKSADAGGASGSVAATTALTLSLGYEVVQLRKAVEEAKATASERERSPQQV
jgi:hypothetical protein